MNDQQPQPHHDDLGPMPQPARLSRAVVTIVLVALVGTGLAFGFTRRHKGPRAEIVPGAGAVAIIEVIKPTTLKTDQALSLSAVTKALEETKIYPRTSGYVRKWLVDMGDKVKQGQLLAEIETPDLEAQLSQARAQLVAARASVKQTQAQAAYSTPNAERNVKMGQQNLVAQATVEQAQAQANTDVANVAAAEANAKAAEANVRHLAELENFTRVIAPFAGTITQRTDRSRVVRDRQRDHADVRARCDRSDPRVRRCAADRRAERQGRHPGHRDVARVRGPCVRRQGHAVGRCARSRSSHDVDRDPGREREAERCSRAHVTIPATAISLPLPHSVVEIPSTALYNGSTGVRVATVTAQQKIHFVPITIDRDTGATLWVATGLAGDERVVKIAVPLLAEGDPVEVKEAPPAAPAAPVAKPK